MSDKAANRALAEALFAALEAMDWPAVAELFTEDGVYQDMPFETDSGGTVGHAGIIGKLEVGLSTLERFDLGVTDIWVSDDDVLVERVEVWHHPDGTVASLPVLCRLQIRDNKIAHWREYWDYNYLIAQQPDTWLPSHPAPAGTDKTADVGSGGGDEDSLAGKAADADVVAGDLHGGGAVG